MTLSFTTNNILPALASIIVLIPPKIPLIYIDPTECWLTLNNIRVDNVCSFGPRQISFKRFISSVYSEDPDYKFFGKIELSFKIKNPDDNEDLKKNAY